MREKAKAISLVAKAVLVLACLVLIIPSVIRLCPFLVGADGSYIVLGGSMQPTLRPGDLAFTVKVDPSDIEAGDIAVVKTDSGVYMHRVLEKRLSGDGILFRLKGDANEDPDPSYVVDSQIIGKTIFSLPTGYVYTKNGYILMVVMPLMLLATHQAIKIYKVYDTRKRRRRGLKAIFLGNGGRRRKISIIDATSILLLIILAAGSTHMMAPYLISRSGSFFTDTESSRIVIQAATWRVPSSITCSVSQSNIMLGENVTIWGRINPARSAEVTIEISTDGGETWAPLITVTSNADGTYKHVWEPDRSGSYKIKASWKGDSSYFGASSEPVTITVKPSEGGGKN